MARRHLALRQFRHYPVALHALLALSLALLAEAPQRAAATEVVLRYGEGDSDYSRIGVGLRFGPVWSDNWGNWKATLDPELELSQFRYDGPASGPDSLEQGGVIAHFRASHGSGRWRPYAEAGLGLSLFSNDTLGAKAFSTHFQFSEHLGLGVEFAEKWFAGWQFSHYSNAQIEKPNDGIELHQVVVGAHF